MSFRISNDGNERDVAEIRNKLIEFNASHGVTNDSTPIEVYYENESGEKLAGITGHAHGNWFFIDLLFVDASLRGRGIGNKLLALAEDDARKQGCKYAFLNTNVFQAPGFYQKAGYECVFKLEEFPLTGEKYYFTKKL